MLIFPATATRTSVVPSNFSTSARSRNATLAQRQSGVVNARQLCRRETSEIDVSPMYIKECIIL
jgi:hypothetical protein